jgi:hypothetical protein
VQIIEGESGMQHTIDTMTATHRRRTRRGAAALAAITALGASLAFAPAAHSDTLDLLGGLPMVSGMLGGAMGDLPGSQNRR